MEDQLLQLAQYGVGGVAIALICLIAYLARIVKELISNHIQHNTDTMDKLQQTITELCIYLKSLNGRLRK